MIGHSPNSAQFVEKRRSGHDQVRVSQAGESSSACSVRPADARSVEVMKGGGEGRRWLLAGSGAAARAVD
jgi:hypothetical protein